MLFQIKVHFYYDFEYYILHIDTFLDMYLTKFSQTIAFFHLYGQDFLENFFLTAKLY